MNEHAIIHGLCIINGFLSKLSMFLHRCFTAVGARTGRELPLPQRTPKKNRETARTWQRKPGLGKTCKEPRSLCKQPGLQRVGYFRWITQTPVRTCKTNAVCHPWGYPKCGSKRLYKEHQQVQRKAGFRFGLFLVWCWDEHGVVPQEIPDLAISSAARARAKHSTLDGL